MKNINKNKGLKTKLGTIMTNKMPVPPKKVVEEIELDLGADFDWENTNDDMKIVTECGRKPASLDIMVSRKAKSKIDFLMKKFPSCEWLAYLMGNEQTRYISDLYIPSQTASGGAVTNVGKKPAGAIGVIHSHHGMGAFFSGTDDAYINKNNDISIVVAHNGVKAQVRWTTPCGYKVEAEGKVIVESENLFSENEFNEIIEQAINTEPVVVNLEQLANKIGSVTNKPKQNLPIPSILCGQNKYVKGFKIGEIGLNKDDDDAENLTEILTKSFM